MIGLCLEMLPADYPALDLGLALWLPDPMDWRWGAKIFQMKMGEGLRVFCYQNKVIEVQGLKTTIHNTQATMREKFGFFLI